MVNITDTPGAFGPVLRPETTDVALGGNETNFPGRQLSELAKRDTFLKNGLDSLALSLTDLSNAIVGMNRGGLGGNNSARAAGQIPFTATEGVIGWLATTPYGRSLLGQANAIETAQTLNIGLGRFAFAQNGTQTTTTSNTYQNTGLSLSITPQSANSKFFVLAVPSLRINRPDGNGASAFIAIYRGAVPGGTLIGATRFNGNFGSSNMLSFSLNNSAVAAAVDSPNTTNPVTYGLGIRAASGEVAINFGVDVDSLLFALEIIT